jgi:hypothetical protein
VGLHPLPWLFGAQRGRDATAEVALFRQRALEPLATRASFIDKDQGGAFGW